MEILEIKVLKEIIEKVPEDYQIEVTSGKNVFKLCDQFEIDVAEKKELDSRNIKLECVILFTIATFLLFLTKIIGSLF